MTAFFAELRTQVGDYQPGDIANTVLGDYRRPHRQQPEPVPYTAEQEAADLATLDRIERQHQDYFDGMGEIAARRVGRAR